MSDWKKVIKWYCDIHVKDGVFDVFDAVFKKQKRHFKKKKIDLKMSLKFKISLPP